MDLLMWLPFFVCLGGAIWMPIVGWITGQTIVKKTEATQNVKSVLGGIIGAVIGFVIWLVFVWPKIIPPLQ